MKGEEVVVYLLPDQLVQPAHVSKSHSPSIKPPLLAVHGFVPVPLTTAIEPDQLVYRPEPGVQNLTGLQKTVFWLPTMFDICGTMLMNIGYTGSLQPKAVTDVSNKLENRGGYFDLSSGFN
ncbi:hypothetical protein BY996DRAFT_6411608 [Phakopsora pachyrhizi]|nr:hypothetical protein BY996DRAFT_6411608 [Phakopsora pachyrhizi]